MTIKFEYRYCKSFVKSLKKDRCYEFIKVFSLLHFFNIKVINYLFIILYIVYQFYFTINVSFLVSVLIIKIHFPAGWLASVLHLLYSNLLIQIYWSSSICWQIPLLALAYFNLLPESIGFPLQRGASGAADARNFRRGAFGAACIRIFSARRLRRRWNVRISPRRLWHSHLC